MSKQEPLNELQRYCHERYQYGRSIFDKMRGKSPADLAERFGPDRKTIARIRDGSTPVKGRFKCSEEELEQIRNLCKEYRELRAEYVKHTAGAIADELGMNKKTVIQYGNGIFGSYVKKVRIDKPKPEFREGDLALQFATMHLTANPANRSHYYY